MPKVPPMLRSITTFFHTTHDMSAPISFRPLTISDKDIIQAFTFRSYCRNCDLNFMNLMSWRFLYGTEMAIHCGNLIFRFKADGHNAYLAPLGDADWAPVIRDMMADSEALGHPFLMLGVCERSLSLLNKAMPGYFYATCERDYSDYVYSSAALASLAGKKLQPKRNHANRFCSKYPDYEYSDLTAEQIPECLELERKWAADKPENSSRLGYDDERRSMEYVFANWEALGGRGGTIRVGGRLVAFTFGAPVNGDTFDVCVEKADTAFEGAYAVINRDFVRHLPEQYVYVNREEDLGIEGLRRAKESYHPVFLLHKYAVMAKHPFNDGTAD